MSDTDSAGGLSLADVVDIVDAQTVAITLIAAAVLFLYDCALLFPSECKYIWRRKWSLSSILYCIFRVSLFLVIFITLLSRFLPTSESACASLNIVSVLLNGVAGAGVRGLTLALVWVIVCKNKWAIAFPIFFGLGSEAVIFASLSYPECIPVPSKARLASNVNVAANVFVTLYECSVTGVVIFRTFRLYAATKDEAKEKSALLAAIFETGLLRLTAICLANVASIITDELFAMYYPHFVGLFNLPVNVIVAGLVCRFYISVCKANDWVAAAAMTKSRSVNGAITTGFVGSNGSVDEASLYHKHGPEDTFMEIGGRSRSSSFYGGPGQDHGHEDDITGLYHKERPHPPLRGDNMV